MADDVESVEENSPQENSGPSSDDDWKAQVAAEKAAAAEEEPADTAAEETGAEEVEPAEDGEVSSASADDAGESTATVDLPPATLEVLSATLATQAMVALGVAGDPDSQAAAADPLLARHLIDLLAMLEEKTEGNRTDAETAMMSNMLHQLRVLCVNAESGT